MWKGKSAMIHGGGNSTKVTVIQGGAKPNVLKELVQNLRENLPSQLELTVLMAKLQRAKFLALKAEGFSDAEALELSKTVY